MDRETTGQPTFSFVVPVQNEHDRLEPLYAQLAAEAQELGQGYELIFVNDGSTDETDVVLRRLQGGDANIRVVELSRAFGSSAAVTAGCHVAGGRAVVTFDRRCENWPELVGDLIARWREGFEIVHAGADGPAKGPAGVWRLLRGGPGQQRADMRLIDQKVLDAMAIAPGASASVDQQIGQVGFRASRIPRRGGAKGPLPARGDLGAVGGLVRTFGAAAAAAAALLGASALLYLVSLILLLTGVDMGGEVRVTTVIIGLVSFQIALMALVGAWALAVVRRSDGRPVYVIRETLGGKRAAAAVSADSDGVGAGGYMVYT